MIIEKFSRKAMMCALLGIVFSPALPANAQEKPQEVVNVYTNREPGLYSATLEEFTKATGIKVNALFSEQGLAERIVAEGASSPADVLITVDIGRLQEAVDKGIAQPVGSPVLKAAIPSQYRDPQDLWNALSLRARVVYASKERVKDTLLTYEDLADPRWKGKICTRSGQHQYNIALIAAMIVKKGEAFTETWLNGVKANLARKPSGGDRDVAKDIAAGLCDIGLGNQYYIGLMTNGGKEDQKKWAEAVKVILPTFKDGGTHINVSGAILVKNAPNRANALKLLEFMVSPEAQRVFADVNYEYPVRAGVAINPLVASFGPLKADTMAVSELAKARTKASELVDKVAFDR
jgi:iron(III) transport system substrate-binding protein